jgi:hypothetical protein
MRIFESILPFPNFHQCTKSSFEWGGPYLKSDLVHTLWKNGHETGWSNIIHRSTNYERNHKSHDG